MFVRDPYGIVCLIITYGAIFYADYIVVMQTMQASIWAPLHVMLFNTVVFLLSTSHLKAVLSNPGTVPLPANSTILM
ncbi:palmitoyltransferase ZDHHC3-A-like isoform X2 [Teleopsis dalmanni]|uniref:palmitoyltransferase ZDHHC3-A-like isoform X2 n=1 Tax=Teleopsis dalmanni TaxID=139649 RepID=UPI0018CE3EC4|nr:palmitoyltransferase ZDHHC3-A-like isoform X2 [Teleopsis dalmanni]